MDTARVERYWQETFGVPDAEFRSPGILVRANSGRVAKRTAAWILVHGDSSLLSVPPGLRDSVQRAVADVPRDALLSPGAIQRLFHGRVRRTVGPSYQGYVEPPDFRPAPSEQVRLLSRNDRPALARLRDACEAESWTESRVSLDSEPLFGCVSAGAIVAVAGIIPWSAYAANPAVITHPSYRGKGCGTAVASAAMAHILERGSVVLYQTLLANRAAVRIATSLGCREYGRMVFVDLEASDGRRNIRGDA